MRVSPTRIPEWFFIDDNGDKTHMKTSPQDWPTEFKTRNGKQPSPSGALVSITQLLLENKHQPEAA